MYNTSPIVPLLWLLVSNPSQIFVQIISMMEYENLLQCWARFIVLLGNPAELMNPKTPQRWYRVETGSNSGGKYKSKNLIEKREFL